MRREEFYQFVQQYVVGMLPEEFSKMAVKTRKAINQSGEYMGLYFVDESLDEAVAPIYNLDNLYEMLGQIPDELEMLMEVATVIRETYDANKNALVYEATMSLMDDYEEVKKNLFITPESLARQNVEPHPLRQYYGDIPCNARVQIVASNLLEQGIASAVVNENLLQNWGKTFDEVFQDAVKNTENIRKTVISPMVNVLEELGMPDIPVETELQSIFIVTNETKIDGASNLFLPGVMDKVADMIGGSYYVIPSSIHEVIVHPVIPGINGTEEDIIALEEMIQEVNREALADEDILSNKAYFYNAVTKEFGAAREQLQKAQVDDLSLIDNLSSTKSESLDADEVSKNIISGITNPRQF